MNKKERRAADNKAKFFRTHRKCLCTRCKEPAWLTKYELARGVRCTKCGGNVVAAKYVE